MLHIPLHQVLKTTKTHLLKLEKLGYKNVEDLLGHFPRKVESSQIVSDATKLLLNQKNTLSGKLYHVHSEKTPRGKRVTRAALVLSDNSTVNVIWFQSPYILKNIKEAVDVFLVGKVSYNSFSGVIQISNPEIYLDQKVHIGGLRAVYSESPPINSKWLREKIAGILPFAQEFTEILPKEILIEENFMSKAKAVQTIHRPKSFEDWQKAKERLAFEELFEIQLRVQYEKSKRKSIQKSSFVIPLDAEAIKKDLTTLPFALTTDQKKVLFQILKDFEKNTPANRLVQGDVGSGKTIVAFLAALQMIRAGFQVAILAPTEILAQQHFHSAHIFFEKISKEIGGNFRVELLTGSIPEKQKKVIKSYLANGKIDLLIGTHAILTEDTVFKDLGLSIVDEQHRFGVAQRAKLDNGKTHKVSMTATPIPRTLALTLYGDQDLSVINEMPAGRKKIITKTIPDTKTATKMEVFMDSEIEKGHQIFWICPLVEESDKLELKDVMSEFERISQRFSDRNVAFLHGKMRPKEKSEIMKKFSQKAFDILVSTSVVEVGVDIPNATVMVIENAERFGLSQLHQFRGRIGRNTLQSYAFLMCGKAEDKNKTRLKAMETHHSGQKLAEIDLELRGMGELYGTKQSGMPDFKVANITDTKMLERTYAAAEKILSENPTLEKYPQLKSKIETGTVWFE